MAKALQCPACGTKRMADTLAGVESFPCATCGKVLKVPPSLSTPDAPPAAPVPPPESPGTPASEVAVEREESTPPARRRRGARSATPDSSGGSAAPVAGGGAQMVVASSAAPGAVPPPPRRRGRAPGAPDEPGVQLRPETPAPVAAVPMAGTRDDAPPDPQNTVPLSAVAAGAAVGAAAGAATGRAGRRMVSSASPAATAVASQPVEEAASPQARSRRVRPAAAASEPDALPVALRILIWVVALPVGLALVGIPARKAGYLSSQKLLDVVIKHNLDRFVPLAVIVVLWALVTAIVVHLLAEGGRKWRHKRKLEHEAATRPRVVSSSPGVVPPPRRPINGNGNGSGTGNGAAEVPQRQSRTASRGGS
jgi:hypothetical protein